MLDWARSATRYHTLPARAMSKKMDHEFHAGFPAVPCPFSAFVIASLSMVYEQIPSVPAEHMELVEQGIASIEAGRCRELADADWEALRQRAHDVASRKSPSSDSRH